MAASLLPIESIGRANGRFPAATQLVGSPRDPSFLALRTTFGLLVSHDGGGRWDWVCEKAIGYGDAGTEDPPLGMTESAILAGTREGLAVSPDQGCSWDFARPEAVVDVVVRRDDPRAALALASTYRGADDAGGAAFDSRVLASVDDGAHWEAHGVTLDPALVLETVDVTPADPRRIYLSGVRWQTLADGGQVPVGALLTSKDDGATYAEHAIPLDPATERAPFVAAVDPTNADRLYVRVQGTTGSRILVSDDAGATFRTVFKGQGDLLGFALSADGTKVFVGGPLDGLYAASSADLLFTKRSDAQLQCLAMIGSALYGCMSDPHAFAVQLVGVSTDDGATFVPKFYLACLRGPLGCPAGTRAAACAADYSQVQTLLAPLSCDGGAAAAEAGAHGGTGDDASAEDDASAPGSSDVPVSSASTMRASGCGCGSPAAAGSGGISAIVLALGAALLRRRRR